MKTDLLSRRARGFSLVEMVIIVAIVGILAAVAYQFASGLGDRIRLAKLVSDVQTLNTGVRIYLASGGSLDGVTDPAQVIRKLKTVRSQDSADRYAGFRGSMVDSRIVPVFQTSEESASDRPRVRWNAEAARFEIRHSGEVGISHFVMDANAGAEDFGEEDRAAGPVDYNTGNGWIWTYRDTAAAAPATPVVVPMGPSSPAGLPAPGTPPQRLAPPQFTTAPGTYDYPSFPVTVSISNPNPAGSSTLYVATVWDGSGIQWVPYTGPLAVQPGMQILTYARQNTAAYEDSFSVGGVYVRKVFPLQVPEIVTSAPYLDLESNAPVNLELIDRNPGFARHRLEYSINGGDFTVYEGPVSLVPGNYAAGFVVVARSMPVEEDFRASPEASKTLGLKLRVPVIEVASADGASLITLGNPNPEGASTILFALRDEASGSTSSFQTYQDSVPVAEHDYPKGFTVIAYANPVSGNFLASDEASSFRLTFFGIPVTGSTIFVLDQSGSMALDDGIGQVKAEMNRVLDMMKPEDQFGIIKFSTDASVVMNWSPATAQNVSTAKYRVGSLTANGLTNYADALGKALQAVRKYDVKQVVFLSDGAPTAGNTSPEYILSLVRQIAAEGTRLDTLAFGRITQDGRELLGRMSEAGLLTR